MNRFLWYVMEMLDLLLTGFVQVLFLCLGSMPHSLRVRTSALLVRSVLACLPRFRRIAQRNIRLAFPTMGEVEREKMLQSHIDSLGRVLADVVRVPRLSRSWVDEHVRAPGLAEFRSLQREKGESGILVATGHLGSFELLARSMALWGLPLSFVVRPLKFPRLNRFIERRRELDGNRVINRRGALAEAIKRLRAGETVAMLIDQNVTKNLAVFVPCFGHLAATTRAFGLAALRTRAHVYVAGITYEGSDVYLVHSQRYSFTAIYDDETLTSDEKIERVTLEVTRAYEDMIRRSPSEWFWVHRRWKTRPAGEAEDWYESTG